MENFCNCCKVLVSSENEKEEHLKTERHRLAIMSDDERNWKYRCFPVSTLPEMWTICSRYKSTGNCNQVSCEEAHGEQELREWKARLQYRIMKLRKVKQSFSAQVLSRQMGEEPSNDGHDEMYEETEGGCVSVSPELSIIIKDETRSMEWTIDVTPKTHLTQVSLLPCEDRNYFCLSGVKVRSEEGFEVFYLRSQVDVWNNPTKSDEHTDGRKYTFQVKFTTPFCGIFSLDVAFRFKEAPLVIKQLEIQVTTAEDFAKISLFRQQIAYFNKWHRGRGVTAVPFENRSNPNSDGREASNCFYPVPVDLKYFTPDILQLPNQYNYQRRMHQLLYIEEAQQQALISSYHCVTVMELIQRLDSPTTSEKPCQEGELFARVHLKRDLTEDTKEGKLALNHSDTLMVAPPVRSPEEKKVYEAIIKTKQRKSVLIRISRMCAEDLRLAPFHPVVVAEVQFQLRAAPFCEMHMALEKLQPVSIVFPDVNLIPQRPCSVSGTHHSLSSHLNSHQRKAVLTMTVPLYIKLPPILIAGPFGTGKSMTIFEATKLLLQDPSNRLLICTHTNSAADAYILNYFEPYSAEHPVARPLRLYHYKQKTDSVDPLIQKFCVMSDSTSNPEFALPGREYILKYRVVISNLRTSRCLMLSGIEKGYFTHIFIDEAAQAMECEAIIPLGLATEDTRIVLAGDPLQTRPRVYSLLARELGFDVSFLQRLWDLYPNNFPCKFLFTQNYSSHEAITKFVSNEFYSNSSISVESNQPAHEKFYPLTYFPARPDEVQDGKNTGYYSFSEINVLVTRVEELKKSWPENWGPQDHSSIAVFTPYYEQVVRIRKELRRRDIGGVFVGKLENAEGRQFRAVFVSTVRRIKYRGLNACNWDFGYITDIERMCSAFIKARSLIAIVGNYNSLCTSAECQHAWINFFAISRKAGSIHHTPFESSQTREPSPSGSNSHQEIIYPEHPFWEDLIPEVSYPRVSSSQNSVLDASSASKTVDIGIPVLKESPCYPRSSTPVISAADVSAQVNSTENVSTVSLSSRASSRNQSLPDLSTSSSTVDSLLRRSHSELSVLEQKVLFKCSDSTGVNFTAEFSSPKDRVVRISSRRTPATHYDGNVSSKCFDPVTEFMASLPPSERPGHTPRVNSAPLKINAPFLTAEQYAKAYIELFREFQGLETVSDDKALAEELANSARQCEFSGLRESSKPSLVENLRLLKSRLPPWIRIEDFLNSRAMQEVLYKKLHRSEGIVMAKKYLSCIHSIRKDCGF